MTKRIFRSTCLVAILVLLSAIVLIMSVLYEYFAILQKTELKEELIFAAKGVENDGTAYLHSLSLTNTRVTWIAKDGTVLFDSVVDPNELGAHEEREEIKEAFETGYGESVRYSDSLLARQLYVAERLSDGSVLRLSSPRASVLALLGGILFPTALFLLGAVLLSLFLSLGVSRKIVKPLNELDVDNLKREDVYEELKPLCDRLSTQKKHLAKQEATLRQKEDQFNAVTEGMREGILLIGPKRIILSANTAALHFFDLTKDAIGRDICAIAPKFRLEALLEEAERNRYAERYHQNDANLHHLIANPILSEGKTIGLCVVILDITEKNKIESLRREFTANVSHELKTPLHAISGYAELLLSGMVKEEDIPVFYQHIYDESGRMIRLVEDIIRLSSLDEGETESGSCSLDLFALASLAADSLRERAEKSGLTMTLEGTSVTITGIPTLLSAAITNLLTNAIKYNREGGYVILRIGEDEQYAYITVEDNGIGIAKEHHERLFERFYRVDKSHSKAVGGTGLGLSIVKHAVKLHRGEITLASEPNVGTKITVSLPK